ncbi:MAG: hypothetical protein AAGA62_17390 [Bacteroidota bacterium]
MTPDLPDDLDKALDQLKGMGRAKAPDLLPSIEAKIKGVKAKVIPLREWRRLVAAAVVVLALNVAGLVYYTQQSVGQVALNEASTEALISDFQIYE